MVEDYRRSLYIHEYEERLIAQRMSRDVADTLIQAFYDSHRNRFILRDDIIKGLLLVTPKDAPNLDKLRKKITDPNQEENIEWIEKYAYQYANGYELFIDEWRPLGDVLQYAPFDSKSVGKQLKAGRLMELQDTVNTYMLQVTEVCLSGDYKPIDYVRQEIEDMILSERRVEFIREVRQELYNEALEQGKLKRYEK